MSISISLATATCRSLSDFRREFTVFSHKSMNFSRISLCFASSKPKTLRNLKKTRIFLKKTEISGIFLDICEFLLSFLGMCPDSIEEIHLKTHNYAKNWRFTRVFGNSGSHTISFSLGPAKRSASLRQSEPYFSTISKGLTPFPLDFDIFS